MHNEPEGLVLRWAYYNDPRYRRGLNEFARQVFGGLDFAPWNRLGYEFPEYTPFSFLDGDRVVANVSASLMNLTVAGRKITAIQIGTVASLPEFRGRGLIRSLMNKAHAHWDEPRRTFFLFANETSADFYQQFGYRRIHEHEFSAKAPSFVPPAVPARKLDLQNTRDRELLRRLADNRAPVSKRLGVHRQSWLLMFHAAAAYPDRLLYIEPLDIALISVISGNTLRLVDVIGERIPPLEQIYPYIGSPHIETVRFMFTPDLMQTAGLLIDPDPESLLLVRGPFPIGTEPFRFPQTSQA